MTAWLEALDCVGSTNDEVRTRMAAGAPSGCAVWATQQTAGRGRLGRTWFSPPDQNLYLSVGIRLVGPRARELADRIPLAVGIAAATTIEEFAPVAVGLKWPNDLEIEGQKLGGVLCEGITTGGCLEAVVIGVGINVNTPRAGFPPDLASRATSLYAITQQTWSLTNLAPRLHRAVTDATEALLSGDAHRVVERFAERDALRGRWVRYTIRPDQRGVADGIDPAGRLRVLHEDGTVTLVAAGEVELAP